ncbi:MAG: sugar ABC transporter permease [Clostridia bacterium]|nr:sugar ABC transporter permease [Clostridia bacterium]
MMLIALVVIVGIFQWMTSGVLLKPMNVSNLINQNAYVVILAVGMLICILTGGNIDLAVGSVVALVGACAGTFIVTWGMNSYISVVLCLIIGIIIGIWQGFWIAYVRIPAFIVTLSGQLVFRGLTLLILKGLTIAPFPQDFQTLSTGFIPDFIGGMFGYSERPNITCLVLGAIIAVVYLIMQISARVKRKKKNYPVENILVTLLRVAIIGAAVIWLFYELAMYRGVPTVLITLGIVLIVYAYITSKTVMGRHIYAIGGNEKAARLSGVKTNKMLFLAYVNMSFLAAIAGIIFAARLNSASPQAGQSFELDAIGACYIGGASAYGGIGTVGGALIGALVMGVLNNGMSIMGISSNAQQVVKGLVLLAAVAIDVISKQKLLTPFLAKFKKAR